MESFVTTSSLPCQWVSHHHPYTVATPTVTKITIPFTFMSPSSCLELIRTVKQSRKAVSHLVALRVAGATGPAGRPTGKPRAFHSAPNALSWGKRQQISGKSRIKERGIRRLAGFRVTHRPRDSDDSDWVRRRIVGKLAPMSASEGVDNEGTTSSRRACRFSAAFMASDQTGAVQYRVPREFATGRRQPGADYAGPLEVLTQTASLGPAESFPCPPAWKCCLLRRVLAHVPVGNAAVIAGN
jgi:hypothetical protein